MKTVHLLIQTDDMDSEYLDVNVFATVEAAKDHLDGWMSPARIDELINGTPQFWESDDCEIMGHDNMKLEYREERIKV